MQPFSRAKRAVLVVAAVLVGSLLCVEDASALYVRLQPHAAALEECVRQVLSVVDAACAFGAEQRKLTHDIWSGGDDHP